MFTASPYIGVIVAVLFICFLLWVVMGQTKTLIANDKILVLLIILITMLTGVWVADKIIAFRIHLLTEDENKQIFDMIRHMIDITLGYYFGTKNTSNDNSGQSI